MRPPDLDDSRHAVARTAALVRSIACKAHKLAVAEGTARPELLGLASLLETVAAEADTAARAIDSCLAAASLATHEPDTTALAITALRASQKWTATLDNALRTATHIYAQVCATAADQLAITEEHLPRPVISDRPAITARNLAITARTLRGRGLLG